jgi:hypothetical protein
MSPMVFVSLFILSILFFGFLGFMIFLFLHFYAKFLEQEDIMELQRKGVWLGEGLG